MHTNPAFRKATRDEAIEIARAHAIGTISINGQEGPMSSHVPFLLHKNGAIAEAHLTRSNPILRALEQPQPALLSVLPVAGYVSPDWYGAEDQVPTLNYVAVHIRGTLRRLEAGALRDHLDRLSAHFEARHLPKPPWRTEKLTADALTRMLRMIVPVSLKVTDIESTRKLNQNKPKFQRLNAADHVEAAGDPVLADLMRGGDGPSADEFR